MVSSTTAFLAAGFSRRSALDVLVIVAAKTISNYANHIAQTPKDAFMSDPAIAWIAPDRPVAA